MVIGGGGYSNRALWLRWTVKGYVCRFAFGALSWLIASAPPLAYP